MKNSEFISNREIVGNINIPYHSEELDPSTCFGIIELAILKISIKKTKEKIEDSLEKENKFLKLNGELELF